MHVSVDKRSFLVPPDNKESIEIYTSCMYISVTTDDLAANENRDDVERSSSHTIANDHHEIPEIYRTVL